MRSPRKADARLLLFAPGKETPAPADASSPGLPVSRLAALLQADHFFEHAGHHVGDWYYDHVAWAFAQLADDVTLGNALRRLEPCSAVLAALDAAGLDRPELIAAYAFHPAFHAEGAYALGQLQQVAVFGPRGERPRPDRGMAGRAAPRTGAHSTPGDQTTDWPSLVALGIHDESQGHSQAALRRCGHRSRQGAIRRRGAVGRSGIERGTRSALRGCARAVFFQARGEYSDAAIVFALRLVVTLRRCGQACTRHAARDRDRRLRTRRTWSWVRASGSFPPSSAHRARCSQSCITRCALTRRPGRSFCGLSIP